MGVKGREKLTTMNSLLLGTQRLLSFLEQLSYETGDGSKLGTNFLVNNF